MKRFFLVFLFVILLTSLAFAVPVEINYQGYLTDSGGVPINGTTNITFKLYDGLDAVQWDSGAAAVDVANGVYSVTLGASPQTAIDPAIFSQDLWLGITVEGDQEMTPRQKLTSVGFSIRALSADSVADGSVTNAAITGPISVTKIEQGPGSTLNADLLDNMDSTAFAAISHQHTTEYYTKSEVDALLASRDASIAAMQGQIDALMTKLQYVTVSGTDMVVEGANVHIRSGSGATDGSVNGLGNLIVGYNELRGTGDVRTGSHNIIVGKQHNYSSYGGVAAGFRSEISGAYATVTGGRHNIASGDYSSVSGGGGQFVNEGNTAFAHYSSILGGIKNIAGDPVKSNHLTGQRSTVSGGDSNVASGLNASVNGGSGNSASGTNSAVNGGAENIASGSQSSVSGGRLNEAAGGWSAVVGGGGGITINRNTAYATYSVILGGFGNFAGDRSKVDSSIGTQSAISGGSNNTTNGTGSSVLGGVSNEANGTNSIVAGGNDNTAEATSSSVGGGAGNTANGASSSVSGGTGNVASGNGASILGGGYNTADGNYSTVVGGGGTVAGGGNRTYANYSSILGGKYNRAGDIASGDQTIGEHSTISGGQWNTASGDFSAVLGGGGYVAADGNISFGDLSSIVGGKSNISGDRSKTDHTIGRSSTIGGGMSNASSGISSSVNGGSNNNADGNYSTVGGGSNRSSSGENDWNAGGLFEDF